MKKIIVSLVTVPAILFTVTTGVAAQDVSFGIRGGLNLTNFIGDDAEFTDNGDTVSPDSKLGINLAGYANIPLTGQFSVQPELIYSQKGAKYTDSDTIFDVDYESLVKWNLTYLEIPVLVKINFDQGEDMIPYLYAGPSVSLNLVAETENEVETTFQGETQTTTETRDIKDDTADMDFGLVIGGGVELATGVTADIRYTMGLVSVDDPDDDTEDPADVYNSAISIMVGYSF